MKKKIAKFFGKGLLRVLYFLFILAVFIELAIAGTVLWLQTDNAQNWAQRQLNAFAQESGYDLSFSNLSYTFPQGLKVHHVAARDTNGVLAELDDLVLRIDFAALIKRHLEFSISVESVTLYRLPDTQIKTDESDLALSPIEEPDMFFSTIRLTELGIKNLDIREAVFGTSHTTSVSFESTVNLEDESEMVMDASLQSGRDKTPWLPDAVQFNGLLDLYTLDLQIDDLDLKNKLYTVKIQGNGNLGAKSMLDFNAKGQVKDLSPLTGMAGAFEMTAHLFGTLDQPALTAKGTLDLPLLKKRGLESIVFEVDNKNLHDGLDGTILVHSEYRDIPVEMSADFFFAETSLTFENIEGHAPHLQLSGALNLDTQTVLAEGDITLALEELGFYSQLLDIDLNGNGQIQATLLSEDGKQGAQLVAHMDQIHYETYEAKQAVIEAMFPNISDTLWPTQMDINATNITAKNVHIESLNTTIQDKNQDNYTFNMKAKGRAQQDFSIEGTATLEGLQKGIISAKNIDIILNSQESTITATGNAYPDNLDIAIKTESFSPIVLPFDLPASMEKALFSGVINISGTAESPVITGDLMITPSLPTEESPVKIALKPYYQNNRAGITFTDKGSTLDVLKGEASLPLTLSFMPWTFEFDQSSPLSGNMNISANAQNIASLFMPANHFLKGNMTGKATLQGTLDAPDFNGSFSMQDGEYYYAEYGIRLSDLRLDGNFGHDYAQITTLSAVDENIGTLSGKGRISFQDISQTDLQLQLDDFQLLNSQKVKGTMSANLNLEGQNESILLTGTIQLGRIDISIPERFRTSIPELNIVQKEKSEEEIDLLKKIEMDIDVIADNQIFVRGWGLDAEFGGQLAMTGALDDPQINGTLSLQRGRYEEFGRRFQLTRANLRFQGSSPPSPYLDIIAEVPLDDINARTHLTGELENPNLSFSSVPTLPDDEVVARILFGRDLNTITPFQAVQLKQTLDRFSGRGGGYDPLGYLRSVTGLDNIRLNTEGEDTSVGVGKYLSEDVYFELEKGQGESSGAAKVEIDITPNISLESKVGQDTQTGAGILWHWDY